MSESPPNFLLVMADQLTVRALPAYGNETVQAPRLESLAEAGVVFDSAYCNSPLCTPSRAAMLTGQLPSRTGVYDNAAELPASIPTIAHYLRSSGYRTCLAGKMHFVGPDQLHGFEERITTDVYPASFDWTPDWERPLDEGLPWYHDMSSVLEAGRSEATLQLDFDEEVAHRAVRKIFDLARDDPDRPFFLVASFTHPHDPYEVPAEYLDRYRGVVIDRPALGAIPDEQLDPHSQRLKAMCGANGLAISDEMVIEARRAYYAAVTYFDDQVGRLLDALDRTGLAGNTIVIVTTDHGDMLGERGLWYKMSFFEPSGRVPLIVYGADRFAPHRVPENVSHVDLLPTLLELAGAGESIQPVDPIDGTSLVPLLQGEDRDWPDTVIGEYLAEGLHAPLVMIRRGAWKYLHCPGDPDQLYDIESDPDECSNLALDPARADLLEAFRAEAASRWDLDQLREQVIASQRRRRLVVGALSRGRYSSWDYRPPDDESTRYVRGNDFWDPFASKRLRPTGPQPAPAVESGS
ncbi:MAG: choline-sulfatase [Chloroflexi bacterium]|nr:choline-sulfatase [Chloroflexota bacterium]